MAAAQQKDRMTPEQIEGITDAFTGIALAICFFTNDQQRRDRTNRWLRPTYVRRQYRKGIKHAQAVLRLIGSTHFFEDNLADTIDGFIPPNASGPYWEAYIRTFEDRADALYQTQLAWRGAIRPGLHNKDW